MAGLSGVDTAAAPTGSFSIDHSANHSSIQQQQQQQQQQESNEFAAAMNEVNNSSGGGGGGNIANNRSFRFLLTLALRRARIAVEHDQADRVPEAIAAYREAVNMLALYYEPNTNYAQAQMQPVAQSHSHSENVTHQYEQSGAALGLRGYSQQQNVPPQSQSVQPQHLMRRHQSREAIRQQQPQQQQQLQQQQHSPALYSHQQHQQQQQQQQQSRQHFPPPSSSSAVANAMPHSQPQSSLLPVHQYSGHIQNAGVSPPQPQQQQQQQQQSQQPQQLQQSTPSHPPVGQINPFADSPPLKPMPDNDLEETLAKPLMSFFGPRPTKSASNRDDGNYNNNNASSSNKGAGQSNSAVDIEADDVMAAMFGGNKKSTKAAKSNNSKSSNSTSMLGNIINGISITNNGGGVGNGSREMGPGSDSFVNNGGNAAYSNARSQVFVPPNYSYQPAGGSRLTPALSSGSNNTQYDPRMSLSTAFTGDTNSFVSSSSGAIRKQSQGEISMNSSSSPPMLPPLREHTRQASSSSASGSIAQAVRQAANLFNVGSSSRHNLHQHSSDSPYMGGGGGGRTSSSTGFSGSVNKYEEDDYNDSNNNNEGEIDIDMTSFFGSSKKNSSKKKRDSNKSTNGNNHEQRRSVTSPNLNSKSTPHLRQSSGILGNARVSGAEYPVQSPSMVSAFSSGSNESPSSQFSMAWEASRAKTQPLNPSQPQQQMLRDKRSRDLLSNSKMSVDGSLKSPSFSSSVPGTPSAMRTSSSMSFLGGGNTGSDSIPPLPSVSTAINRASTSSAGYPSQSGQQQQPQQQQVQSQQKRSVYAPLFSNNVQAALLSPKGTSASKKFLRVLIEPPTEFPPSAMLSPTSPTGNNNSSSLANWATPFAPMSPTSPPPNGRPSSIMSIGGGPLQSLSGSAAAVATHSAAFSPTHRAFALAYRFMRSLENGGWLSDRVHIPRSVWYQGGVKLQAYELKLQVLDTLTPALLRLAQVVVIPPFALPPSGQSTSVKEARRQSVVIDMASIAALAPAALRELEHLEHVTLQLQKELSKKLKFIPDVNQMYAHGGISISSNGSGSKSSSGGVFRSMTLRFGGKSSDALNGSANGGTAGSSGGKNESTVNASGVVGVGDKVDNTADYAAKLLSFFQATQFANDWMLYFSALSAGQVNVLQQQLQTLRLSSTSADDSSGNNSGRQSVASNSTGNAVEPDSGVDLQLHSSSHQGHSKSLSSIHLSTNVPTALTSPANVRLYQQVVARLTRLAEFLDCSVLAFVSRDLQTLSMKQLRGAQDWMLD
ncbi:hypothetical protein GQ42DRAFT_158707 [Ramicandelaber brevisporus]|nr:hypothetical protein GQ42DRAFT_158707 [Ramicandelaber brevisporus]